MQSFGDRHTLSDFPDEFDAEVVACNKRYVCRGGDETGFYWHASDDPTLQGVRGCRVDAIVAAAAANHCNKTVDRLYASEACRRTEPCLQTSENPHELRCIKELDHDGAMNATRGMPDVLDAGWRCVSTHPTTEEYEKVATEFFGDLATLRLRRKQEDRPELAAQVEKAMVSTIAADVVPPSDPDTATRVSDGAVSSGPAPSGASPLTTAAAPSPHDPLQQPPSLAPRVCDWFQGPTYQGCRLDTDCPIPADTAFDVWFDTMLAKLNTQGASMTMESFLSAARDTTHKSELTWGALHGDASSDRALPPRDLGQSLRSMFHGDPQFRDSIARTVRTASFRSGLQEEMAGSCVQQRCQGQPSRPSINLFSGNNPLVFSETEDGSVFYSSQSGHRQRPLHVKSCNAADAPPECRMEDVPLVQSLDGKPPALTHASPLSNLYRLRFPEGNEYLFRNAVLAEGATDSDRQERCARTLCELNARECPAPHCTLANGTCQPNQELVTTVQLR